MLFCSVEFVVFFVVVFFVFHALLKEKTKAQNIFLLVASYFFYGYADWRMLPLLVIATIVFYGLGIAIGNAKTEKANSILSTVGIVFGVGLLVYFKYLNFFIESFAILFESIGLKTNIHTFKIVMPLGISFFTFKLISYVVEVHRGTTEPTKDLVSFATYVSFFPCILSGPIDRPDFMEQLQRKRVFDYDDGVDAMRQILWGVFKKMVVADNCAFFVDSVWKDIAGQSGSTLALSAVLYAFQMYADFSGYSDMAIGVGKLLGFKITRNFNNPFFALNIADYWRRWHMSLTSWLTDYVFTPLNMRLRDWGKMGMILAIIINMVVVGLWHGANWTFVVFGLYHGLLFVPLILSGVFMKKSKLKTNRFGLPILKDFGRMLLTFILVTVGLVIFRAESIDMAWEYFIGMVQFGTLRASYRFFLPNMNLVWPTNLFIIVMLTIEWLQRGKDHGLDLKGNKNRILKWIVCFIIALVIYSFAADSIGTFIYFQF